MMVLIIVSCITLIGTCCHIVNKHAREDCSNIKIKIKKE
jgi:hypothetical protein